MGRGISNITDNIARKFGFQMLAEYRRSGRKVVHLKHTCGAEVISVSDRNEEKKFSVTFRTPPENSSGVPHILEHCVFNGSKKYPVNDIMQELKQNCFYTTLNACTHYDFTVFTAASTHLKDYYIMLDAYLDAVYHPKCIRNFRSLQQEGCRLECDSSFGELHFRGIVLSEMKGFYSDPSDLFLNISRRVLFPDNAYGFDNGGRPTDIIRLTFKEFQEFHRKHYQPGNSLIWLSGDDDPVQRLRILAGFLNNLEPSPSIKEIKIQKFLPSPIRSILKYPFSESISKRKYMITINWMLSEKPIDLQTDILYSFLQYFLLETDRSPLKKALEDSGYGDKVIDYGIERFILQPTFTVGMDGVEEEDIQNVEELIFSTLKKLGKRMNPKLFNKWVCEFEQNFSEEEEHDIILHDCIAKWVHGMSPILTMKYVERAKAFRKMAANKGPSILCSLIRQTLVENCHHATVILQPDSSDSSASFSNNDEKEHLRKIKFHMTGEDFRNVHDTTAYFQHHLKPIYSTTVIRSSPDLDVKSLPEILPYQVAAIEGNKVLLHHEESYGDVLIMEVAFNIGSLKTEHLSLLPLFCLLDEAPQYSIGTGELFFRKEWDKLAPEMSVCPFVSAMQNSSTPCAHLIFSSNCLVHDVWDLLTKIKVLFDNVISPVGKENKKRYIRASIAKMEASMYTSADAFASIRMDSKLNAAGYIFENIGGLSYLESLRLLEKRIDEDWDGIHRLIIEIAEQLQRQDGCTFSVACNKRYFKRCMTPIKWFVKDLPSRSIIRPTWSERVYRGNEAILMPTQVNHVGRAYNLYDDGDYTLSGSSHVIAHYLTNTWLYDQVRVRGAAYGVTASFNPHSGVFSCISSLDPNLLRTLEVYDGASRFLQSMNMDKISLTKAIKAGINDIRYSCPSPSSSMRCYLANVTIQERIERRREMLSTSVADFHEFGNALEAARANSVTVAVASEEDTSLANKKFQNFFKTIRGL